jgi:hypothetical protein
VESRASRSIERLRTAARVAALVGAGYFLVATSAPIIEPQSCVHPTETITVAVTGTCGPAGTIVLETLENECSISVHDAPAVGLPNAGRFANFEGKRKVSLLTSPWTLSGDIGFGVANDAGAGAGAPPDAATNVDADADGGRSGDGGAPDGAPYVPPPLPSAFPFTLRVCNAVVAPKQPLRLACTDDRDAGATCTADLAPQ